MKLSSINIPKEGWHVSIDGITKIDNNKPIIMFTDKNMAINYRKENKNRTILHFKFNINNPAFVKISKIKTYYNNPEMLDGYDSAISKNIVLILNHKSVGLTLIYTQTM